MFQKKSSRFVGLFLGSSLLSLSMGLASGQYEEEIGDLLAKDPVAFYEKQITRDLDYHNKNTWAKGTDEDAKAKYTHCMLEQMHLNAAPVFWTKEAQDRKRILGTKLTFQISSVSENLSDKFRESFNRGLSSAQKTQLDFDRFMSAFQGVLKNLQRFNSMGAEKDARELRDLLTTIVNESFYKKQDATLENLFLDTALPYATKVQNFESFDVDALSDEEIDEMFIAVQAQNLADEAFKGSQPGGNALFNMGPADGGGNVSQEGFFPEGKFDQLSQEEQNLIKEVKKLNKIIARENEGEEDDETEVFGPVVPHDYSGYSAEYPGGEMVPLCKNRVLDELKGGSEDEYCDKFIKVREDIETFFKENPGGIYSIQNFRDVEDSNMGGKGNPLLETLRAELSRRFGAEKKLLVVESRVNGSEDDLQLTIYDSKIYNAASLQRSPSMKSQLNFPELNTGSVPFYPKQTVLGVRFQSKSSGRIFNHFNISGGVGHIERNFKPNLKELARHVSLNDLDRDAMTYVIGDFQGASLKWLTEGEDEGFLNYYNGQIACELADGIPAVAEQFRDGGIYKNGCISWVNPAMAQQGPMIPNQISVDQGTQGPDVLVDQKGASFNPQVPHDAPLPMNNPPVAPQAQNGGWQQPQNGVRIMQMNPNFVAHAQQVNFPQQQGVNRVQIPAPMQMNPNFVAHAQQFNFQQKQGVNRMQIPAPMQMNSNFVAHPQNVPPVNGQSMNYNLVPGNFPVGKAFNQGNGGFVPSKLDPSKSLVPALNPLPNNGFSGGHGGKKIYQVINEKGCFSKDFFDNRITGRNKPFMARLFPIGQKLAVDEVQRLKAFGGSLGAQPSFKKFEQRANGNLSACFPVNLDGTLNEEFVRVQVYNGIHGGVKARYGGRQLSRLEILELATLAQHARDNENQGFHFGKLLPLAQDAHKNPAAPAVKLNMKNAIAVDDLSTQVKTQIWEKQSGNLNLKALNQKMRNRTYAFFGELFKNNLKVTEADAMAIAKFLGEYDKQSKQPDFMRKFSEKATSQWTLPVDPMTRKLNDTFVNDKITLGIQGEIQARYGNGKVLSVKEIIELSEIGRLPFGSVQKVRWASIKAGA